MNSIGRIGLIMPEITDPLDYELLDGVCGQAAALGYDVIILSGVLNSVPDEKHDYYMEGFDNIYSLICKSHLDGIIFAANRFRSEKLIDKIFDYISQTNIPVLSLEYKHEGIPCINAEQHDGAYAMTRHLIDIHGCRRLYCIAGFPNHEPSQERLQGFLDAMKDSGLDIGENSIYYGKYWRNVPEQVARDIAAGKLACPDGVVCLSDSMAVYLGNELSRNGIAVPEKVKITGFDGMWYSAMHDPMITTVCGRDKQFGETAVCRLYEMMTGRKCEPLGNCQTIRYGTSCGCSLERVASQSGFLDSIQKKVEKQLFRSFEKKSLLGVDFISQVSNAADITALMNAVDNVGHILHGWKWLDICLCEDWQSDFDNPYNFRQHSFSDRMYLALSKRYGSNEQNEYFFCTEDILPALCQPHEPVVTVLTSLHCKGQIFGYCAMAYDSPDDIELDDYFVNWTDSVSSGLFSLKQRLYISYIHQQLESFSTTDTITEMPNRRGFTERLPDTLHRLRKMEQVYGVLLISWIECSSSDAYDTAVITANALKKTVPNQLCARLEDKIFAVLLSADKSDQLNSAADALITNMTSKLTALLGNSALLPEFITEFTELPGKKPAELEKSVQNICISFTGKRASEANHYAAYREQLYKLRREIMTQPQLDWNIPDISIALAISKTHLQRLYKELFSTGIKDDVIHSRMNRAMQLLTHTDLRVQEIAEQCGYQNANHFMRQFKEKNGVTALQYRKNHQESFSNKT